MKKIIFLVFILFQTLIYAQFRKQITYGFYAGANYSQMSNLKNVFIPQNFYQGFNTNEEGKIGAVAGFFLNWKYEEQRVSIQPEIFYSRQTTDFNYNDIKGLNYTVNFSYDYLNAGFLIKYYP
ncbi:TPA: PorT family protein, partial [Flavobacterium psychrophilum]